MKRCESELLDSHTVIMIGMTPIPLITSIVFVLIDGVAILIPLTLLLGFTLGYQKMKWLNVLIIVIACSLSACLLDTAFGFVMWQVATIVEMSGAVVGYGFGYEWQRAEATLCQA